MMNEKTQKTFAGKNLQTAFLILILLVFVSAVRAETFTVNTNSDAGDGTCDATECTLREAVAAANGAATDDTIEFDASLSGQTISLAMGELSIADNGTLTINGLGADQLTVSGNGSRVFFIDSANASINALFIRGGNSISPSFNNLGGGIFNNNGTLSLNSVEVSANFTFDEGGGIYNSLGDLTITDSAIINNTGNIAAKGGGIYNSNGTVTLINTTVSRNELGFFGNPQGEIGGGVYNDGGVFTLNNSTVSDNISGSGSGIYNSAGIINLNNTIVADNNSQETGVGNCVRVGGTINAVYSLIEDELTCINGTNSNNLTGDPALQFTGDNGGPTRTSALRPTSIAIDAGNSTLPTDQRGFPRPVDDPGSPNGSGNLADIGAFEASATTPMIFTVNTTSDGTSDGTCDATECTLREAIATANKNTGAAVITFSIPTSDPGYDAVNDRYTITLMQGEITIFDSSTVTIEGLGANRLNISGGGRSRIFQLADNSIAAINGITIQNGSEFSGSGFGGGILNNGTLTLNKSVIDTNAAINGGGGIASFGELTINDSTINNNATFSLGGGILNFDFGKLTINNSTISNNSQVGTDSNSGGGGIAADNLTDINSTTISNNSANGGLGGGGILSFAATNLLNTIVANSAFGGDCDRIAGTINASYSLIEDGLNCVNGTNSNNLTGDPMLGTFGNNGGTTPTYSLLPGSIAIDAGDSTLMTDQRGAFRPINDPNSADGSGNLADIGAFEVQSPTAAAVSISGRVTDGKRGVARATVHITDQNGNIHTARTTSFGYYRFTDVEVGQSLLVNVFHKRYQFNPQVINTIDSIANLDFTAQ